MICYDIDIQWTNSFKRQPPVRLAGDRMALYMLATISAALLPLFRMSAMDGSTATAYAGVFMIFSLHTIRSRSDLQPPDRRREIACLAIACMAYSLGVEDRLLLGLESEALSLSSYLFDLSETFMLPGLLFVSWGSVAVIWFRARQSRRDAESTRAELRLKNKELEHLKHNLDRMVELRTAELEEDNRSMAIAFRERAEALAEMSVLEERSRIAHEIHDVVGHTLTAAIVQLEVTKRMAEQQGCVPWDKLELLNELVRKGLDDIRRAVKMIKSDEAETMALEAALQELIQYAEDTMEIAIEADISISSKPELELGKLTEQVLYHALQEGLTNGIRHGKCDRARFSLHASDGTLRFRLVSDGEPYGSSVPGFGLSCMIERVKLLGGGVVVRSSADADGNPIGCELSIDLPLAG